MVAGIPDATVFQNQGQGQPIESGLGQPSPHQRSPQNIGALWRNWPAGCKDDVLVEVSWRSRLAA